MCIIASELITQYIIEIHISLLNYARFKLAKELTVAKRMNKLAQNTNTSKRNEEMKVLMVKKI